MIDYRTSENRGVLFEKLYNLNLTHGIMPGLVYLYFPLLKTANQWDEEECLWFAFLNGMTQNPLTSLRMMEQLPEPPSTPDKLMYFTNWFNSAWETLQFDTDRRYQKKDAPEAIKSYCRALYEFPSQAAMLDGRTYGDLWKFASTSFKSFGRLGTFSYLEYLQIFGHGTPCDDLLFEDRSGSRSHRNGMLFLVGQDNLVHDKRIDNGFNGEYPDFKKMCAWLGRQAARYQDNYNGARAGQPSTNFTFESQLCTFKNHFFGRRYPGVYADMAYERLNWYAFHVARDNNYNLIRDIYETLPEWLKFRNDGLTVKQRGAIFPATGRPYRADHFLPE